MSCCDSCTCSSQTPAVRASDASAIGGLDGIDASRTVNDVIAAHPATVAVFSSFGIDACCGGALTIADATARHRLDAAAVLAALHAAAAAA